MPFKFDKHLVRSCFFHWKSVKIVVLSFKTPLRPVRTFRPSARPPSVRPSARPSAQAGAGRTYIHKLLIERHGRLLLVCWPLARSYVQNSSCLAILSKVIGPAQSGQQVHGQQSWHRQSLNVLVVGGPNILKHHMFLQSLKLNLI